MHNVHANKTVSQQRHDTLKTCDTMIHQVTRRAGIYKTRGMNGENSARLGVCIAILPLAKTTEASRDTKGD